MKYSGANAECDPDDVDDVDPDGDIDADVEIDPEVKEEVDEEETIIEQVCMARRNTLGTTGS